MVLIANGVRPRGTQGPVRATSGGTAYRSARPGRHDPTPTQPSPRPSPRHRDQPRQDPYRSPRGHRCAHRWAPKMPPETTFPQIRGHSRVEPRGVEPDTGKALTCDFVEKLGQNHRFDPARHCMIPLDPGPVRTRTHALESVCIDKYSISPSLLEAHRRPNINSLLHIIAALPTARTDQPFQDPSTPTAFNHHRQPRRQQIRIPPHP